MGSPFRSIPISFKTSQPTTDRYTLTLIDLPTVDKNENLSTTGRELRIGASQPAAPPCNNELSPLGCCCMGQPSSTVQSPGCPLRQEEAPRTPYCQGRPPSIQHNRQAQGQKAVKKIIYSIQISARLHASGINLHVDALVSSQPLGWNDGTRGPAARLHLTAMSRNL